MTDDGWLKVDPVLETDMLRAIGYVVVEGSFLAESVQSFAKSLAGTPLVADLLADAPLGGQVRQVRRLLAAVRAREQFDAGLAVQIGQVLSILNGPLIRRRNDVAHGLWGASPAWDAKPGGPTDGIGCERWTTAGLVATNTTVRSLYLVGDAMRIASRVLGHAGSVHDLSGPRYPETDRQVLLASGYWDPAPALADLSAAVTAMDGRHG